MHVWLGSELERVCTTTEHFGMRLDSDVGLESHDDFVCFGHRVDKIWAHPMKKTRKYKSKWQNKNPAKSWVFVYPFAEDLYLFHP